MTLPIPAVPPPPSPHLVASADGHRAELICQVPDGASRGLLWLPALGVPARNYLLFANALAASGVAVALLEWRGLGSSNRRAARGSDWGYRELLADIDANRSVLSRQFPGMSWFIGGHSLGGQLAVLALACSPDAYLGYALAGSGQPWWRTFPAWQQPFALAVFPGFRAIAALCGYFPGKRIGFAGTEARGVIRDWARSGFTGRYVVDGVDLDLEAALGRLNHPVLALHLASDSYVPTRSLDHLLAKMPHTKTLRDEIADAEFARGRAGHFEWLRDPSPVASRISRWLLDGATPDAPPCPELAEMDA